MQEAFLTWEAHSARSSEVFIFSQYLRAYHSFEDTSDYPSHLFVSFCRARTAWDAAVSLSVLGLDQALGLLFD